MRVPLVVSGPQLRGASRRVSTVTSHLDVAPTMLGLLSVPVPITMKGRDLSRDRAATLVPFKSRPPASQIGLRDGAFKYVHTGETGARELFDLSRDPGEKENLAASHAALIRQYDERLAGWEAHSATLIEGYASILKKHGHACPR
jgi:arylsulfatase A-like enzyme